MLKLRRVFIMLSRGSSDTFVVRGDRANAERRWGDAAAAYSAALDRDPTLFAVWVQYGHSLKEQGHLLEAERAYRQAIKLNQTDADAHLQLGHVLKLQGAYREALESYEAGRRLDPTDADLVREADDLSAIAPAIADDAAALPRSQRSLDLLEAVNRAQGAADANLERFLRNVGLSAEVVEAFDESYYFYAHRDVADDLGAVDPARCLLHFIDRGIDRLHSIAEDFDFDGAFYRETYLGKFPLDDATTYRHWLRGGCSRGFWPNRKLFVRSVLGLSEDDAQTLDLATFASYQGWRSGSWTWAQAFNEFVATGGGEDQPTQITKDNVGLMLVIADRLAVSGTEDRALRLYERILDVVPSHANALHHYADALLRRGCLLAAKQSYERVEHVSGPRPWVFLNRAACEQGLGRPDRAVRMIEKAVGHFPGDLFLRRRLMELTRIHLAQVWRWATEVARAGDYSRGQQALAAAHGAVAKRIRVGRPSKQAPIVSVALIANQHLAQCKFYRVDQKVEQLVHAGYVVEVFDHETDLAKFVENAFRFQAAIFYRVPAHADLMQAIAEVRGLGIITFYEIDDLIFDAAAYPPPMASYSGLIDEDEHVGLALGVPLFHTALEQCEHVIVSTSSLAREVLRLWPDKQVYVHRNGLDSRHLLAARNAGGRRPREQVTIFYGSATKAHKEDFNELAESALSEIGRRYGSRVRVVIAGHAPRMERLASAGLDLVLVEGTVAPNRYWAVLAAADINLAVLRPTVLTDTKSEIKWLEAAMMGIPSIVSDTATYTESLRSGTDAVICRTKEDWLEALERLVRDRSLRERIGAAARAKALQSYSVAALSAGLHNFLRSVAPPPVTKPRILIVNVFYPPQAIGGATRVVHDNVQHFGRYDACRFDVEVACSIEGDENAYRLRSNVFESIRVHGISTPDRRDIDRVVLDADMGTAFRRVLDVVQPDLVHFHCIQRLTVAVVQECWRMGIPYVITAHDGWWISNNQFLVNERTDKVETHDFSDPIAGAIADYNSISDIMLKRTALENAVHVIAVSRSFADIYRKAGVTNVISIPNGLPPIQPARRTPSNDGCVRLGFVGGLSRHKGFHLIKYALKSGRFNNLRAIMIDLSLAPGASRAEIWGATAVEFRAKVPQSKVPLLYSELDVLLAPSVWPESYGLVTREALHCGCWVIASDRGAIGEDIVEGRNGFRIDVSDPHALRERLRLIDATPEKFLQSTLERPTLRTATEQGSDLSALYLSILEERLSKAGASQGDGCDELDRPMSRKWQA